MELMQLEMFVAAVEEHSVSRAAARVGRSQPAVSLALASLEREVGFRLVDRSRQRGCTPTSAGLLVYEYASRILGLRRELVCLLKDNNYGLDGNLSVGVYQGVSPRFIAKFMATFSEKYRGPRVHMQCDREGNYISDLLNRKIDVAFLSELSEEAQASSELVSVRLENLRKKSTLWMVLHRIGRSHVVRVFEELVTSTRKSVSSGKTNVADVIYHKHAHR